MRRAFTFAELLTVIAILLLLGTLAQPSYNEAKKQANIRSSSARLVNLHVAVTLYRLDHESDSLTSSLPPRSLVYTTYLGLGEDHFKSPCGNNSTPNKQGLSYQYTWSGWSFEQPYFDKYGEKSMIFVDKNCNRDSRVWQSEAAVKRGLGVTLEGSLKNLLRAGSDFEMEWWH
jgi:Tfp pilus assembly protein PilE